jgi:hypothetical protein
MTDNLANVFTKALARPVYKDLVNRLNVLLRGDAKKLDYVMIKTLKVDYRKG